MGCLGCDEYRHGASQAARLVAYQEVVRSLDFEGLLRWEEVKLVPKEVAVLQEEAEVGLLEVDLQVVGRLVVQRPSALHLEVDSQDS